MKRKRNHLAPLVAAIAFGSAATAEANKAYQTVYADGTVLEYRSCETLTNHYKDGVEYRWISGSTSSKECWLCPKDWSLDSNGQQKCYRAETNATKATKLAKANGMHCAKGRWEAKDGYCYECPANYNKNVFIAWTADNVCEPIGKRLYQKHLDYNKDEQCPESYTPIDGRGGERRCIKCPDGFKLRPPIRFNVRSPSYDSSGRNQCMTDPAANQETLWSNTCNRVFESFRTGDSSVGGVTANCLTSIAQGAVCTFMKGMVGASFELDPFQQWPEPPPVPECATEEGFGRMVCNLVVGKGMKHAQIATCIARASQKVVNQDPPDWTTISPAACGLAGNAIGWGATYFALKKVRPQSGKTKRAQSKLASAGAKLGTALGIGVAFEHAVRACVIGTENGICPTEAPYPFLLGSHCCAIQPIDFALREVDGRKGYDAGVCKGYYRKCSDAGGCVRPGVCPRHQPFPFLLGTHCCAVQPEGMAARIVDGRKGNDYGVCPAGNSYSKCLDDNQNNGCQKP